MALDKEWIDMGYVFQTQAGVYIISKNLAEKKTCHMYIGQSFFFGANDIHVTFLGEIPAQDKSKLKFRQLIYIYEHCPKKNLKHSKCWVSKWCCECSAPLCVPIVKLLQGFPHFKICALDF